MSGIGCQQKGNGKAMGYANGGSVHGHKSSSDSVHYRSGGFVKNPTPKPAMHQMPGGHMMADAAMPMPKMKKGKR